MIEVRHVRQTAGNRVLLDDLSFTVPPGQICGYLGPNGAGKTTTIRLLCGLTTPTAGTVTVAGFDVGRDPLEVKRRVGYVPESGALYESLTPVEYLTIVGDLHRVGSLGSKIDRMLGFWGIADRAHSRMAGFSKGMKQKVVLTAALLHDPEVLLLDEPLDGLDAGAVVLLRGLLVALARRGRTVFYCSHLLDVVEKMADRVLILAAGRLVADEQLAELRNRPSFASLEETFNEVTLSLDPGEQIQRLADELFPVRSA